MVRTARNSFSLELIPGAIFFCLVTGMRLYRGHGFDGHFFSYIVEPSAAMIMMSKLDFRTDAASGRAADVSENLSAP